MIRCNEQDEQCSGFVRDARHRADTRIPLYSFFGNSGIALKTAGLVLCEMTDRVGFGRVHGSYSSHPFHTEPADENNPERHQLWPVHYSCCCCRSHSQRARLCTAELRSQRIVESAIYYTPVIALSTCTWERVAITAASPNARNAF